MVAWAATDRLPAEEAVMRTKRSRAVLAEEKGEGGGDGGDQEVGTLYAA